MLGGRERERECEREIVSEVCSLIKNVRLIKGGRESSLGLGFKGRKERVGGGR